MNSLWQPRSGCGPGCLPPPGVTPMVSRTRQVGRLAALLGVLVAGAGLSAVLPLLPERARPGAAQALARAALRALGVRLVTRGRLSRRRALLVANHISWVDILAVLAVSPARLVAKREVRRWPVIGALAAASGTIFVDRARPRELTGTVARAAAALRGGGVVAVFPEGTTTCAAARGFRPAMFQAAIDASAVVVPLTLDYRTGAGSRTTVAAFVGDDTLWRSLRRVLAVRGLVVSVAAAPALHPAAGASRRVLARVAESAVRSAEPMVTAAPAAATAPNAPVVQLPAQPSRGLAA